MIDVGISREWILRHRVALMMLVVLCPCGNDAAQNVAPGPVLTLPSNLVTVHENEARQKELILSANPITCVDADGDQTRVGISSMSPDRPCPNCFSILPCTLDPTEFCLLFQPSEGSLDYDRATSYNILVGCTDDAEPETTEALTVAVIPNSPPNFDPNTLYVAETVDGQATAANDEIYHVKTIDADGDPVYYSMTTTPASENFYIGYTDGKIRAKRDLRFECNSKVQASVTATDKKTGNIGPLIVDITIDNPNSAPVAHNLDTTIYVDENVGEGTVVLDLDVVDNDVFNDLSINMKTSSHSGLDIYELDGTELRLKIDPDYERDDTRSIDLTFDLHDGFCASKTYTLTVEINDINEQMELDYFEMKKTVYEGNIDFRGNWDVYDQDIGDSHRFDLSVGAKGRFGVRPDSGEFYSLGEIDVDKGVDPDFYEIYQKVTDEGDNVLYRYVQLTVLDKNDNAPYFTSTPYTFAATECTQPGSVIGKVEGDDDDSDFQNNDKLVFGGGGAFMAVMSGGSVVLTTACRNTDTGSGTATIKDQGVYPGPLQGNSAPMSFSCGPCPTTPPPVPPVTTTTTGAPGTVSTDNTSGGLEDYLGWVIPAIILGMLWLALLAYMLYRYCRPWCAKCCCRRRGRVKVRPIEPVKQRQPKQPDLGIKKLPPAPKREVARAPPAPAEQEEEIEMAAQNAHLFGFWMERYPNTHYKKMPLRDVKPIPIEQMSDDEEDGKDDKADKKEDEKPAKDKPVDKKPKKRIFFCLGTKK